MTSVAEEVNGILEQLIGEGMAQGGSGKAVELFLRWICDDEVYESFDLALRDRMLGNGDVLLGVEIEPIRSYLPSPERLAAVATPCIVAAGAGNRDRSPRGLWFVEASQWLAEGLGAPLIDTRDATSRRPRIRASSSRPSDRSSPRSRPTALGPDNS